MQLFTVLKLILKQTSDHSYSKPSPLILRLLSHCLTAVAAASLRPNTQTEDESAHCQRLKIICLHLPRPASLKPKCFIYLFIYFCCNEVIKHVQLSKDDNESFVCEYVTT